MRGTGQLLVMLKDKPLLASIQELGLTLCLLLSYCFRLSTVSGLAAHSREQVAEKRCPKAVPPLPNVGTGELPQPDPPVLPQAHLLWQLGDAVQVKSFCISEYTFRTTVKMFFPYIENLKLHS